MRKRTVIVFVAAALAALFVVIRASSWVNGIPLLGEATNTPILPAKSEPTTPRLLDVAPDKRTTGVGVQGLHRLPGKIPLLEKDLWLLTKPSEIIGMGRELADAGDANAAADVAAAALRCLAMLGSMEKEAALQREFDSSMYTDEQRVIWKNRYRDCHQSFPDAGDLRAVEQHYTDLAAKGGSVRSLAAKLKTEDKADVLQMVPDLLVSEDPFAVADTLHYLQTRGQLNIREDIVNAGITEHERGEIVSAAIDILACQLGRPCGSDSPFMLERCIYVGHGACGVSWDEFLRFNVLSPAQYEQAMSLTQYFRELIKKPENFIRVATAG